MYKVYENQTLLYPAKIRYLTFCGNFHVYYIRNFHNSMEPSKKIMLPTLIYF